jgi:predicted nucleic acid-binding protein
VRLVVDTGVFSAARSRRRRPSFEVHVASLSGNQLFLAAATVAELRYGALIAEWGSPRRDRLEAASAATTVVPVTDQYLTTVAQLRAACRHAGHPLADRTHSNDLWIAATAIHINAELVIADQIFSHVPRLALS